MEKKRRKLITFIAVLLLVGAMITSSLILVNQNKGMFANEEKHLMHLGASIDKNIHSVLSARKDALQTFLSRSSVKAAKITWLYNSQNTEFLDSLFSEFSSNEITKAVLVLRNGRVIASSDGNNTLSFDQYVPDNYLLPFIYENGETGLLVLSEEDNEGISVGISIDLANFYREIISSEMAKENWVLLLDSNSQMMIHYQNYKVLADPIDAVTGATCGPDGIELIKKIQSKAEVSSGQYEYWDSVNKEEHAAFLTVIPSNLSYNGCFAIGVAAQMDEMIGLINNSTVGYIIATFVWALGAVIIAWFIRKDKIISKENEEELMILREKNKQMKELEEKHNNMAHAVRLETIGTLTSSISHEFNNLLTPIMADSALALDKISDDDKELGEYLETIYNTSIRAKRLVSRLSFLSRKSSNDEKVNLEVLQLISKALDSAAPIKPENVTTHIDCKEGIFIYASELLLHQTILNLIINAYQAMEDGGGELTISGIKTDEGVAIKVKDTGKGIPKESIDKVFDPFFTTKGSGKGTGLGLAISKQIIEDNGGSIALESVQGEGTTFTLSFPNSKASR